MKTKIQHKAKLFLFFTILTFILPVTSCDDSTDPHDNNNVTEARSEIEAITEFAAVKQSVTYDILKLFSDNYTKKLFQNDDLTYAEIDEMYAKLASLQGYEEAVEDAINSMLYKTSLNKAGNIRSTKGLGDAVSGFFSWISGSGERSRNRILTVATNMNEGERTKLYNSLRPDWKQKSSSESDFWQKLDKGDYDNQASQMYNDFYHNADSDFPYMAQDKGLTIQKIVHKEGAEGVEKGSKLMIEVVKTATPLGKGMDMVEKADEYKQKVENLYNDPANTIKEEVKSAIANKIGGFVDIDGAVDSEWISEHTGNAIKFITDYTLGSDDPSEWIKKGLDFGLGKLLDSDNKGSKADIVLAEKKNDDGNGPSVVISVDPKDDDFNEDDVIDILVSAGDWIFSTFDAEGNNDKVDISIADGMGTIIVISTDPEGDHTQGAYGLSVWASPSDPGPGVGVTVYARVSPVAQNIQIYFSITGTDGYSNEGTYATDATGLATFYIPGGAEDVRDVVTIQIVESGLTRTINYTF
ncbi:MAG: hypothetical protein KDC88_08655 [Ignavibacteriae bacterium]|nr:hypothetical protein [Ignavibacteriota bacterium]MCB9259671.1 hypothetical protein [Ignavibacteriales bacterium]